VRTWQVHLVSQGISWASLNQFVAALRFFYGVTMRCPEIPERITYARQPRRLPVVLSADEVVRFLEAVPSLKNRTALTTAYAAGLRVSEVVALKLADIDSGRMVIRVEQGKGRKDRYVMLSAQLLGILRIYWRLARPTFAHHLALLRKVKWVVYAKRPFGGPEQVLVYLGRYTHRVPHSIQAEECCFLLHQMGPSHQSLECACFGE
jgi:integrase